jgi:hypothetical protein
MADETTTFLVSWDCNGLETCINVSDQEKKEIWNTLSNNNESTGFFQTVNAVLLRARYNPQRHYEVYTVKVDESINEEDMWRMFSDNPQGMADLIRERGNKIYSDRATQGAKIV